MNTKRWIIGLAAIGIASMADPAAGSPSKAPKYPGLQADAKRTKKFDDLRSKKVRPPRSKDQGSAPKGQTRRVEGWLEYYEDGMALLAVEVTAAQQKALIKGGAYLVEGEGRVRHRAIRGGRYYQMYEVRDVDPVILESRRGQRVRVDLQRTHGGRTVIVGVVDAKD